MSKALLRFTIVYLTLYCFATQIAGGLFILPNASMPAFGTVKPMRDVTFWIARHVFGATEPLVYAGNSGDTLFHWVQMAWLLMLALVIASVWMLADRKGPPRTGGSSGADLYGPRWFRLFVRFALAAQMFYFGMAKVIPTQFPPPSLATLVEPAGNLSLSAMLWTSIGSSTPYEIFTGVAEVVAGLLLLTPRTTLLGALVALADLTLVFVLNMSYDVGLKQIAFHLLLMAVYLIAPDAKRLLNLFVLDRAAGQSTEPPLFASPHANRRALIAQLAFGAYLLAIFTSVSLHSWATDGGGGAPKSPLYGIWNVDRMWIDGEPRLPVTNDYDRRWRRVIFDAPGLLVIQRTDDSFAHYPLSIDVGSRHLDLRKGRSRLWQSTFSYERPTADRLVIEGRMDDRTIRAELRLVELDTLRLLNSTFRWVHPPD